MRFVVISDTHCKLDKVTIPDGDVLIHCGDATMIGDVREVSRFAYEFNALKHRHKIFIPGNHDWLFDREEKQARKIMGDGCAVLIDEGIEINGIKIYGSPWQPEFGEWAFNLPRNSPRLRYYWSNIPKGLDILVTHGPPWGKLDLALDYEASEPMSGLPNRTINVGCRFLRDRIGIIKPRYHVFGHIHSGYGSDATGYTRFFNASICDEKYRPVNTPTVLDIEPQGRDDANNRADKAVS